MTKATGMDDVLIREGSRPDYPGLRDLWAVTWGATYTPLVGDAGVDTMLADLDASDGRNMLPGRDERVLVAMLDGQIVGSAIFAERHGNAYLWGMYVRPTSQRRGVGAALLAGVAALLPPTTTIEASVLVSSAGAGAFYRRCGFTEVGPCTSNLTEDDPGRPSVVMAIPAGRLQQDVGVTFQLNPRECD